MQVKPIPTNKVLARHPENKAVLWELPGQGVYLGFSNSVHLSRICSFAEFQANYRILLDQGWILEELN